ncbi:MAG: histidinol-phosphate transaminase [Rhodocyclaceae bacterium]|nr:histidinol-phosphate transaminase [Rhodocyclaceae bacterium]
MSLCDLAPACIRAISPYQPGKPISELAREMGLPEEGIVKLASNENPLGMSPLARQAALAALDDISRYPDGNGFVLKKALSERFGVDMNAIVLGNGSNDVLELAARAFLEPGTSAVYSQYAFAVYPLAIQAAGAHGSQVPARDYAHDPGAMIAAIGSDTRMLFIANPNNPTGTLMEPGTVHTLLKSVPSDVVVVLDEAYTEYLPPELRSDPLPLLKEFPNLIVSRTFSKAYGLAGLRVGYALAAPDVADMLNRVRQPFNVNNVALAAAAAALGDDAFLAESYVANRRGMEQLVHGVKRLGLEYIPSHGNFLTVRVGDAARINLALLKQGVIVRPIGAYGLPEHLRVSVGLESENARFLEALEKCL